MSNNTQDKASPGIPSMPKSISNIKEDISKVPGIPADLSSDKLSSMIPGNLANMSSGDLSSLISGNLSNMPSSDLSSLVSGNLANMSPASFVSDGTNSPAIVALKYLLYTLYSLVGGLIYYPTFVANIPQSTLEDSLPKHDLCMKMGISERICKKKIKCLLKKCDYLDDPIGYKLDKKFKKNYNKKGRRGQSETTKKIMMGGGKKYTKKYIKKNGWRKHLTKNMIKELKRNYEKKILKKVIGKHQKKNTKKLKKYIRGGSNALNENTCKNKKSHKLCNLSPPIEYEDPKRFSRNLKNEIDILKMFGGGNEEKIKGHIIGLIEKHNKALHKKIKESPEVISNIISGIKKKYPLAVKTALMFPDKIKQFSGQLAPYIANLNIDEIPTKQLNCFLQRNQRVKASQALL